jgi:hypothetical protein
MMLGPMARAGFMPPPEILPIVKMAKAIIPPTPKACTSFGALLSKYKLINANWNINEAIISTYTDSFKYFPSGFGKPSPLIFLENLTEKFTEVF